MQRLLPGRIVPSTGRGRGGGGAAPGVEDHPVVDLAGHVQACAAERQLPVSYVPGAPLVVRIGVQPADGASAWAVEETPPGLVRIDHIGDGQFISVTYLNLDSVALRNYQALAGDTNGDGEPDHCRDHRPQ